MIDPIYLLFSIIAMQFSVEFAGAYEVGAERFLDDDSVLSRDAVETGVTEIANNLNEIIRWDGQIKNDVLADTGPRFAELL